MFDFKIGNIPPEAAKDLDKIGMGFGEGLGKFAERPIVSALLAGVTLVLLAAGIKTAVEAYRVIQVDLKHGSDIEVKGNKQ
jgi:hypothetical protein